VSIAFRNVEASWEDPVSTWPYEAIVTTLERGGLIDWQPLVRDIRSHPWGRSARAIESYAKNPSDRAVADYFLLVVDDARKEYADAERDEVVSRVQQAVWSSGLTQSEFARLVGTSGSRLSTYLSGAVTPQATMLLRIERESAAVQKEKSRTPTAT